ncbi:MAG: hypothetical protein R3C53_19055 [Pirellulaceae bacterium]
MINAQVIDNLPGGYDGPFDYILNSDGWPDELECYPVLSTGRAAR